ncbi:hypothetical protein KP509_01G031100 [Ceratopteris richardii]|uniref:Uncharacterized protein n=1 Tax=Ceratopteris richardii TaxID=49495 RepID=A0A8T2VFK0_CERRI|nr:hypothetical protein KP509_01G031100 [Ceratopteris richardii]
MGRAPCCEKIGLNRGAWTREEDTKLIEYIAAHGEGNWRTLPKAAGLLRCGKSCRLRWINYLRPDLKRGNITEEEDNLIIKLHSILGNRSNTNQKINIGNAISKIIRADSMCACRWSLIAGRLPGRTDNEIKNYWNTHLKKKLKGMGIDPNTHQALMEVDHQPTKSTAKPPSISSVNHNEKSPVMPLKRSRFLDIKNCIPSAPLSFLPYYSTPLLGDGGLRSPDYECFPSVTQHLVDENSCPTGALKKFSSNINKYEIDRFLGSGVVSAPYVAPKPSNVRNALGAKSCHVARSDYKAKPMFKLECNGAASGGRPLEDHSSAAVARRLSCSASGVHLRSSRNIQHDAASNITEASLPHPIIAAPSPSSNACCSNVSSSSSTCAFSSLVSSGNPQNSSTLAQCRRFIYAPPNHDSTVYTLDSNRVGDSSRNELLIQAHTSTPSARSWNHLNHDSTSVQAPASNLFSLPKPLLLDSALDIDVCPERSSSLSSDGHLFMNNSTAIPSMSIRKNVLVADNALQRASDKACSSAIAGACKSDSMANEVIPSNQEATCYPRPTAANKRWKLPDISYKTDVMKPMPFMDMSAVNLENLLTMKYEGDGDQTVVTMDDVVNNTDEGIMLPSTPISLGIPDMWDLDAGIEHHLEEENQDVEDHLQPLSTPTSHQELLKTIWSSTTLNPWESMYSFIQMSKAPSQSDQKLV